MPDATDDPTSAPPPGTAAARPAPATDSPLGRAYRDLLAAFEAPADPAADRCAHCVTEADVAALDGPVDALDPGLVARFVRKAGTTWGAPSDLRRLAPRALALAADHRLPLDRALLWHKLRWAGWPDWPPRQVAAVHRFLAEEWSRLLRTDPRPAHAAHRWLGTLAATTADLGPYLHAWDEALGPDRDPEVLHPAACHLALLVNASELRPDLPATVADLFPTAGDAPPAASGLPEPAQQLATWLAEPATREALEHAAVVLVGTRDARRIGVAADRLARFAAAWEAERAAPGTGAAAQQVLADPAVGSGRTGAPSGATDTSGGAGHEPAASVGAAAGGRRADEGAAADGPRQPGPVQAQHGGPGTGRGRTGP